MSTHRFRLKFTFWLDVLKPEQEALAETIEDLKRDRSFARTIRDGIRLMVSLRQRRTDVLFELFPFLQTELLQATPKADETGSPLEQQLERIEKLLLKTSADVPVAAAPQPILEPVGQGGIKQLNVPNIAAPVFDDDDDGDLLVVKKDETAGKRATQNFINAMMALQQ